MWALRLDMFHLYLFIFLFFFSPRSLFGVLTEVFGVHNNRFQKPHRRLIGSSAEEVLTNDQPAFRTVLGIIFTPSMNALSTDVRAKTRYVWSILVSPLLSPFIFSIIVSPCIVRRLRNGSSSLSRIPRCFHLSQQLIPKVTQEISHVLMNVCHVHGAGEAIAKLSPDL